MRFTVIVSSAFALSLLFACKDQGATQATPTPEAPKASTQPKAEELKKAEEPKKAEGEKAAAADPTAEAKQLYQARCVVCHGATGEGDGVTAATLNPKPRKFSDPTWQKSVTDEQIAAIIIKGGAAVGKSPLMPPNPDLAGKKEVVDALVKIVRGFGQGGEAASQ